MQSSNGNAAGQLSYTVVPPRCIILAVYPRLVPSHLLLLALFLLSLVLSSGLAAAAATPFQSLTPTPENVIHQPLVIKGSGEAARMPVDVERDGVPLYLVLALLLLLFVPAAAYVALRRRHQ